MVPMSDWLTRYRPQIELLGRLAPAWVTRYRKFLIAALGLLVEVAALWQNAPQWAIAVGVIATALVWAVPNTEPPEPPEPAESDFGLFA